MISIKQIEKFFEIIIRMVNHTDDESQFMQKKMVNRVFDLYIAYLNDLLNHTIHEYDMLYHGLEGLKKLNFGEKAQNDMIGILLEDITKDIAEDITEKGKSTIKAIEDEDDNLEDVIARLSIIREANSENDAQILENIKLKNAKKITQKISECLKNTNMYTANKKYAEAISFLKKRIELMIILQTKNLVRPFFSLAELLVLQGEEYLNSVPEMTGQIFLDSLAILNLIPLKRGNILDVEMQKARIHGDLCNLYFYRANLQSDFPSVSSYLTIDILYKNSISHLSEAIDNYNNCLSLSNLPREKIEKLHESIRVYHSELQEAWMMKSLNKIINDLYKIYNNHPDPKLNALGRYPNASYRILIEIVSSCKIAIAEFGPQYQRELPLQSNHNLVCHSLLNWRENLTFIKDSYLRKKRLTQLDTRPFSLEVGLNQLVMAQQIRLVNYYTGNNLLFNSRRTKSSVSVTEANQKSKLENEKRKVKKFG